jgi:L-ribulose-5-phosphate 3-epimerase
MPLAEVEEVLAGGGLSLLSGMIAMAGEDYSSLESIRRTGGVVPDGTWDANRSAAHANAVVAEHLGIHLVTFHAGFIPHDPVMTDYSMLIDRIQRVAAPFVERGISVALETGQETAEALLELLRRLDNPSIGVNFDPANMILYGMGDPVAALRALAAQVRQLHVKDALPSRRHGEWGLEVPAGEGAVDWHALFGVMRASGVSVDLVIEREAGDRRVEDVRTAAALVRHYRMVA